jgi:hypothetical protein
MAEYVDSGEPFSWKEDVYRAMFRVDYHFLLLEQPEAKEWFLEWKTLFQRLESVFFVRCPLV